MLYITNSEFKNCIAQEGAAIWNKDGGMIFSRGNRFSNDFNGLTNRTELTINDFKNNKQDIHQFIDFRLLNNLSRAYIERGQIFLENARS